MSGTKMRFKSDDLHSQAQIEIRIDECGDISVNVAQDGAHVPISAATAKALGKALVDAGERQEAKELAALRELVKPATALYTGYSIALKPGQRNEEIRGNLAAAIKKVNNL